MNDINDINPELRKIWDVELDLLEKFKSICKKHDLKYLATSGTLLGAARHKGFIPWDDDIDVSMMWSDYKKLMEVAPGECEYPYYFQCIYTDKDAIPNAARLRRSDTTGFTKWEHENCGPDYDRGIFIDIFPLFYVPDSEEERAEQKRTVLEYWAIIRGFEALQYKNRTGLATAYDQYIPLYEEYCEKQNASIDIVKLKEAYIDACVWGDKPSGTIGATSSKVHAKHLMWDAELLDGEIELPFENTTICCPKEYERILERHYGDWRTPVRGGAEHQMAAIDPKIPWREFDLSKLDAKE